MDTQALQVSPGRAEEEDVFSLWQVDHLSFQPQTADLHPRQLVLVLYGLHVQQALLSGEHVTCERRMNISCRVLLLNML